MLTDLAAYGVELYARLQAATGIDVHHVRCGSLLLARTPGRMDELRELAAVARRNGVPYELVSPEGVQRLFPLASTEVLLGGLHQPDDGHINRGLGTLALAAGAHREGGPVREGVRVRGVRTEHGHLVAVETDRGVVECETAVLATGLCADRPSLPAPADHGGAGPAVRDALARSTAQDGA
jgi:glycine/D-amino acid oxidase-like deaminating enzyme